MELVSTVVRRHSNFLLSSLKPYRPGFFLTSAAEKTKTQGQNSSKKLKEKTQPLGATLLQFVKTQEKTHLLAKFPGVHLDMPFL